MSSWRDTIKTEKASNSWKDTITEEPVNRSEEAKLMGLLQGGSGGLLEEASGLVEGAGRAVGVKGAGGSFHDIQLAEDGPTLDWETLKQAYQEARNSKRNTLSKLQKDYPTESTVSEVAGAFVSPFNKITKGMSLLKGGAAIGGINAFGNSDADLTEGNVEQALMDTGRGVATGAAFGAGSDLLLKGAGKLANAAITKKASNMIADKFRKFGEQAALNSTGATGAQVSKFADNAGGELLDRGIVKFGNSQADIAMNAANAVQNANNQIYDALNSLQKKGVTVDVNVIYNTIKSKISELKGDPSQADVARLLEKELDNLLEASYAKNTFNFGVLDAEKIKRGYNRKAGNWADPEKGLVGKEMYRTYRGAVEDAAEAADPSTAALFKEGKESYGLLAPIEEAAARRAAVTSQSPPGGLLDIATAGTMGIPAALARRLISPRLSSSAAVTSDKISKAIRNAPQFTGELASKSVVPLSGYLAGQTVGPSENYYGSFPESLTQQIESDEQAIEVEKLIKNAPSLPASEKAKRLKLLRDFGRIYVGQ